jgi:tetratricopeptide (TPR) repeat protein
LVDHKISEDTAAEPDLNKAKQLMQAGNFNDAQRFLLTKLDEFPENTDAIYLLAACERYMKNYTSALKLLSNLKQLSPDHSRAYQETGHVYKALRNADAALTAYSQATQLNPALLVSLRAQIEILESPDRINTIGRLSDVVFRLKQQLSTIESTPKPLVAVIDLISQNKLVKAEQICKAFMQKNPRHVEGLRLLADIASRLGIQEDAEFLLESAVAFDENNTRVRIDYIQVLRKQQKYALALQQAVDLLNIEPDNPQFQSVFAVESMQSGDYSSALSMFDSILAILPEDPVTLTSRGHALKTLGETVQAVDSYRRAIKKHPAHGEAYYSMANLKLFSFTDQEITAMESQEGNPMISHMSRVYLDFALGKAYEDK